MGTVEWLTMALLAAATIIATLVQRSPIRSVHPIQVDLPVDSLRFGVSVLAEVLDGVTLTNGDGVPILHPIRDVPILHPIRPSQAQSL